MKTYKSIEVVCQNGHVIVETAYDTERSTFDSARRETLEFVRRLDLFCKLCRSRNWEVREKTRDAAEIGQIFERFCGEQKKTVENHAKSVKGN